MSNKKDDWVEKAKSDFQNHCIDWNSPTDFNLTVDEMQKWFVDYVVQAKAEGMIEMREKCADEVIKLRIGGMGAGVHEAVAKAIRSIAVESNKEEIKDQLSSQ